MGIRSWFKSAASGRFVTRREALRRPGSTFEQKAGPAFPSYERELVEQQYAQKIAKDIRENFPPQQALDIPAYIESRFGGVG